MASNLLHSTQDDLICYSQASLGQRKPWVSSQESRRPSEGLTWPYPSRHFDLHAKKQLSFGGVQGLLLIFLLPEEHQSVSFFRGPVNLDRGHLPVLLEFMEQPVLEAGVYTTRSKSKEGTVIFGIHSGSFSLKFRLALYLFISMVNIARTQKNSHAWWHGRIRHLFSPPLHS